VTRADGDRDVAPRWVGSRCAEVRSGVDHLSHQILRLANEPLPRAEFLRRTLNMLLDATGSHEAEVWVAEDESCARISLSADRELTFSRLACPKHPSPGGELPSPSLLCDVARGSTDVTVNGYSVVSLAHKPGIKTSGTRTLVYQLQVGKDPIGWLRLEADSTAGSPASLKPVVQTFGLALVSQRSLAALRERVKELTGLYTLSRLTEDLDTEVAELLQGVADLLPPAWQYPEIAVGQIELDGSSWTSADGDSSKWRQAADLVVAGEVRGRVVVSYGEPRPEMDEGPFLAEERRLLDAVAREVASFLERRQAAEERERLQEQLLHADRLATIGQLAAGVAHELNEPLGAVLGFAQLARASGELPPQTDGDVSKIEAAALHAREVVKKLMFFARQTATRTDRVDVNRVVEDVLYFLEARCGKRSIRVKRELCEDLPDILADRSQLQQVLVNLVVNAIHAMPRGGDLVISTIDHTSSVVLRVADTGCGMADEILDKVFLPFVTTKDVGEGTGLGLSVVHGIVTAHNGTIGVESRQGEGTIFEVEFPSVGAASDGGGRG